MSSPKPYCLNVSIQIAEEHREEFLKEIKLDRDHSIADEPLCLQFVIAESVDTRNSFLFHEEYIGKAGFDAHAASPHYARWKAFSSKPGVVTSVSVKFSNGCHEAVKVEPYAFDGEVRIVELSLEVKEDRLEEFVFNMEKLKQSVDKSEPLNINYIYGPDTIQPNLFHIYEAYQGEIGFKEHGASEHYKESGKFMATGPLASGVKLNFYNTV